ncbi:chitin-binding protein [Rickettsia fournieri]|uniref:chitin-binding protein n=1 Tax=Rickettsia fournieri TaxID=1436798 RepID=UPI001FD75610|nr:chitin-binding protein [Rickettsia fournieri]
MQHYDLEEIYSELSDKFPYWDHTLAPSKMIEVTFPNREPGYYVAEVDWIVADIPRLLHSLLLNIRMRLHR